MTGTALRRAPAGVASPRRARAGVVAALLALMALPVVSGAQEVSPCNVPNQIRKVPPSYEATKAPTFPTGAATIAGFAVKPSQPDVVYVTNGDAVMRSGDAGCHWDLVFAFSPTGSAEVPLTAATAEITSIVIPNDQRAASRVLLTVVEAGEGAGRPHVLRSDSGNTGTYALADAGLSAAGRIVDLRVAPSDARIAYLTMRSVPPPPVPGGVPGLPGGSPLPASAGAAVYRSGDGGSTWTQRSDATDLAGAQTIDDLAISTVDPERLWVAANGQLRDSVDGGASFDDAGLPAASQEQRGYRITTVGTYRSRVFAFSATNNEGQPLLLRSDDTGRTYREQRVPFEAESVAFGRNENDVVAGGVFSQGFQVWQLSGQGVWRDVTPFPSAVPFRVQTDRVRYLRYGTNGKEVFRTIRQLGKPVLGEIPPLDEVGELRGARPASLQPRGADIRLEIGQTKTVDYLLDLPRRPTPLDMYILVDNSKSMKDFIDALKERLASVVTTLKRQGIDVNAGLGIYQTLSDPPIYDRIVDIGPPGTPFFQGLGQMRADAAGSQESVYDAVYQAVTGEGRANIVFPVLSPCDVPQSGVEPPADLPGCKIAKGENANFRPGALRVVLHAGNEKWSTTIEGAPTMDKTAAAYRTRGVLHVGIAVLKAAVKDMSDLSLRTGAVAPPEGVDCDGNGAADIPAGGPLVCRNSGDLANTLVQILNGVRDIQQVQFFARGKPPVLLDLQPQVVRGVNVKKDNKIRFRVTFSCVDVRAGSYEVALGAALRSTQLAQTTALVTCGLLPVPGQAPPDPAIPPVAQAPVAPAPAPLAPAPVQPVTQVQTQIQTNVNPNVGSATEEEETFQVAAAGVDLSEEKSAPADQYAMTALPRREDEGVPAAALVGMGAIGMAGAATGLALGRRTAEQQSQQPARIRR